MSLVLTNLVGDPLQIISQDLSKKEAIDMLTQPTQGTGNATTTSIIPATQNRKLTTKEGKSTTITSSRLMRRPKDSTSFTLNQIKRDKLNSAKTIGKKNTSVSLPNNTTPTTTPSRTYSPNPTTPSKNTTTTTMTIISSSTLLKVKINLRVNMGLLRRSVSIQKTCLIF